MAPAITPLDPPPDATNLANGLRCARAAQCGSGFCVDGVCCDSACSSRCMACTGQKTGTGALPGSCGFITGGLDPDEECKGPLNRCDGDGGCVTLTREQIGRLTGRPD